MKIKALRLLPESLFLKGNFSQGTNNSLTKGG
jgi:hypothetical protein